MFDAILFPFFCQKILCVKRGDTNAYYPIKQS